MSAKTVKIIWIIEKTTYHPVYAKTSNELEVEAVSRRRSHISERMNSELLLQLIKESPVGKTVYFTGDSKKLLNFWDRLRSR